MIEINPAAGLKMPAKEYARDRVLAAEEISRQVAAAKREGYPFGPLYLLLLLTGQRRGEISGMCWSEIDWEKLVWTIPSERSKNGYAHEVPPSNVVIQILQRLPRFLHCDYVFTTTGRRPVSGFGRAKSRVEEAVGTSDWRVHDLRRTAASCMARLGTAPHVIEKVLNHRTGIISGVAAVYNRYGYALEKREALERWAEQVFAKDGLDRCQLKVQSETNGVR